MFNKFSIVILISSFVIILILSYYALAQQIPPEAQPGAVEKKFLEEKERLEKEIEERKRKKPEIERPAYEELKPEAIEEKIFIKRIEVTGNKVVKDEEIRDIVSPYEGKELTFSDMNKIVSLIKEYYIEKGYITTLVYLPEQKIEEGVLKINIIEGKLSEVKVEGNRYFKDYIIKRDIRIKKGEVINLSQLSRDLRRINRKPDKNVKAVLSPGKELGTTDLTLKTEDRFPLHLSLDANNQGTKTIGKEKGGLLIRHDNLLGLDDTLIGRVQFGKHVSSLATDYILPLKTSSTKIGFGYSYSRVYPKGAYSDLDIEGKARTYRLFLNQDVIDTDLFLGTLNLSLDHKTIKTDVLDQELSRDDLRVARLGFDLKGYDPIGKTFIFNSVDFGIPDIMGGAKAKDAPNMSRSGAGGRFTKYTASFIRLNRMPFNTTASLKIDGQYSNDKLVSAEQFYMGGADTIRGYPEGEFLADKGIIISAEYLIPAFMLPKGFRFPKAKVDLRDQIQLVAFFDWGEGRFKDPGAGDIEKKTMAGVGGGLKIRLFNNTFVRLEWAAPVNSRPSDGSNSKFHFVIQTELF